MLYKTFHFSIVLAAFLCACGTKEPEPDKNVDTNDATSPSVYPGIPGPPGKNGKDGDDGEDGKDGLADFEDPDDSLSVVIYDNNELLIGNRLNNQWLTNVGANEIIIQLIDQGIAKFNLQSGDLSDSVSINKNEGTLDAESYCVYTSSDCSGQCYLNGDNYKPLKNAIFNNAGTLQIVNGIEPDAGGQAINSVYSQDTCISVGNIAIHSSYAITSPYNFPTGISLPLAVPLQFEVTDP